MWTAAAVHISLRQRSHTTASAPFLDWGYTYCTPPSPQAKRYRRAATEAAAAALRAQRARGPNAIARLLLVDPHLDQVSRALLTSPCLPFIHFL